MTTEISTLLAIGAGVVLLLAGGVYWWLNRTPVIERRENEPLPLFGSTQPDEWSSPPAPRTEPARAPVRSSVDEFPRGEPVRNEHPRNEPTRDEPPRPRPVIREFVTRTTPPAAAPVAPPPAKLVAQPAAQPAAASAPPMSAARAPVPAAAPTDHAIVSDAGVPGTMVEGHTLRFSVPAEGTLQFLPGRLEINSGLDTGREIRFVRVEGPNGIEVTFGRSDGELYRHVQLRDKTVSRAHAVMRFRDGHWALQNLSHTNPVMLNGVQMAGDAMHTLSDGDRVEMGEVLFTFRSR